jgi:hypothetical protein
MLEGLDAIDWSELTHAYGSAQDVPGLLRDLADGSQEAISIFYGNIWHQGTVYEATAPTVPFLLEILADPGCACRCGILALLGQLATGSSYLAAHQDLEWYRNERNTDEFRGQVQREHQWVRDARAAVVAGTPVYLRLVEDPAPDVRATAPTVLAVCAERVAEIEPVLRQRIRIEPDPVARASAVLGLGGLWARAERRGRSDDPPPVERTALVADLMRDAGQPPLVRFVAALQTLWRGGADYLDEALGAFRATIDACAEGYADLPQAEGGNPHGAAADALSAFPEAELRWLFEWLRHPDPHQRVEAAFSVQTFCQRWRFAPARVVPLLVELLSDPDKGVREQVARTIPELGRARFLAVERLQALQAQPNEATATLAHQVLTAVRNRKSEYTAENWNRPPRNRFEVPAAIRLIEESLDSRKGDHYAAADAAQCMGLLGVEAAEAVPVLRRCLSHESQWVRIRAAQALWSITGDADVILPTVLEELQCRPVGLLAAELAGEMRAAAAVPILQRIVNSETRLVRTGAHDSWIDQDEGFAEAARRALERIERAPGSVP